MTTRKANSVADTVTTSTTSSSTTTTTNHQNQPRSRSPSSGVPGAEAAGGGAEMFVAFQDWCLRTYGDTAKTKTVTRRKYNKILQTLVQGDEENSNGVFLHEKGNNHINAKFKFWVKSKGFQVRTLRDEKNGSSDRAVLYVPIKATVSASSSFTLSDVCVCVSCSTLRACPSRRGYPYLPREKRSVAYVCVCVCFRLNNITFPGSVPWLQQTPVPIQS